MVLIILMRWGVEMSCELSLDLAHRHLGLWEMHNTRGERQLHALLEAGAPCVCDSLRHRRVQGCIVWGGSSGWRSAINACDVSAHKTYRR